MPDLPDALNTPPEIDFQDGEKWKPGSDPARRIAYSRHRHKLPKLTCGGKTFVFPVGTEGIRSSGSALLGIHKYLGRHYVDCQVIHSDENHIEMVGTFPGLTAVKNRQDLQNLLVMVAPKFLHVPGVFPHIQTVYVENYEFNHDREDRTHSFDYQVSFVRTTTGAKVNDNQIAVHSTFSSSPSQEKGGSTKSLSERVVTVTEATQTLRGLSSLVYGDADKWRALVDLNSDSLADYNSRNVGPSIDLPPDYLLPIMRLEIGTRLRY